MNQSDLPVIQRSMKLPGRGSQGFSVAGAIIRLWLLPDALLMVRNHRVSEDYNYFELKDIQAIVVRRTRRSVILNWVLGGLIVALGVLLGVLQTMGHGDVGLYVGFSSLLLPLVICLVVNLFLGPSCVCHLRTAVQEVELPSLRRLRTARKAVARIVPAIEAAQGELSAQDRAELDTWEARYFAGLLDSPSSGSAQT